MTDSPLLDGTPPSALAMGLTRSYGGLPALPGVMPELDSVVHDPAVPDSHGPMEGKLLPDEHFTLAALKAELGEGKSFPVVHIASHFVMETGSGQEPYLMMGGDETGQDTGYEWNLSDMVNSSIAFHRGHAYPHTFGLRHRKGVQEQKWSGDGQSWNGRAAEGC